MQVPILLQRTYNFYTDCDLKLSTVEKSQIFSSGPRALWSVHQKLQFVREMVLSVPSAVCLMLRDMGCIPNTAKDVFVLVKEGTRELDDSPGLLSSAAQQPRDWKISFHFVFQIMASQVQFSGAYEMIVRFIMTRLSKDLALLLDLVGIQVRTVSSAHASAWCSLSCHHLNTCFCLARLIMSPLEHMLLPGAADHVTT